MTKHKRTNAEFNDECANDEILSPGRYCQSAPSLIIRSSFPKKVPPPTPDGREGRLFPPEQSYKTALLVVELIDSRNKILRKL